MSEEILGRVSAFADGECAEAESRAAIASLDNPETRAVWGRYQLIGDAMRADLPRFIDPGFASSLQAAIAKEPAILVPPAAPRSPVWLRPVAGVAIAATVAAVAVIGVGQRPGGVGTPDVQVASASGSPRIESSAVGVIATPPAFVAAAPNALTVGTTPVVDETLDSGAAGWIPVDATDGVVGPAHQRLNSYIMHYSEQRTMLGSPGVLPYAKVVGYSPDR